MLSGVCYKSNKNLKAKALLYRAYGVKSLRSAGRLKRRLLNSLLKWLCWYDFTITAV